MKYLPIFIILSKVILIQSAKKDIKGIFKISKPDQ